MVFIGPIRALPSASGRRVHIFQFETEIASLPEAGETVQHAEDRCPGYVYGGPICDMGLMRRYSEVRNLMAANISALLLLFLAYTGFAISLWPNMIPPSVSIWEAAAPATEYGLYAYRSIFIIPFILAYTAWSYYVFRGKVRAEDGYH